MLIGQARVTCENPGQIRGVSHLVLMQTTKDGVVSKLQGHKVRIIARLSSG